MARSAGWTEGQDGLQPCYRERLHAPATVFVLVLGLAAIVGIAYGSAYGSTWGWLVGVALCLVGMAGLVATSTILRVDDTVVRAGRARLPLTAIATVHPLDPEAMRHAKRFGDPRDYLVLRAWSSRSGVAIGLADPRDPHPRWVISTRHPDRLTAAIEEAKAKASETPGKALPAGE